MKYQELDIPALHILSPPVRGAWVEISTKLKFWTSPQGRPLCGGRGLKCSGSKAGGPAGRRPLCGGRGLK